jgi:ABC-type dipeptide/oligopeptide/nickel transport system ATPase component
MPTTDREITLRFLAGPTDAGYAPRGQPGRALRHLGLKDKQARQERILAMLNRVGLEEPILERRPQECSGG